MTKVTLNNLSNLQNENTAVSTINGNSTTIVTAFDNTISRDGTSPNQMGADLDMNSHNLLNVKNLNVAGLTINGIAVNTANLATLNPVTDGAVFSNISGSTAIPTGNTLSQILDHTVGTTQGSIITRTATNWTSILPGASGTYLHSNGPSANIDWIPLTGGGNMLSTNNLSDVASVSTSRVNLGGTAAGIGMFTAATGAAAQSIIGQYETVAAASAATIPAGTPSIRIARYATGSPLCYATYIPGASTGLMAFQDASGNWWNLDVTGGVVHVEWFGTGGLSVAYAALPSNGGMVIVPSGYTETFTSNLILSKHGCGFMFMGSATITMGTFVILNTAGINGNYFIAPSNAQDVHASTASQGVRFIYTGTGFAFQIGQDTGVRTAHFKMSGITVDISGGGTNARGIVIFNTQYFRIENTHVNCSGAGTKSMYGIQLSGGTQTVNDFTGYGIIDSCEIDSAKYGIITTGQTNDNTMIGGAIVSVNASGTIGIYRQGGAGFWMTNTELGSLATAILLDVNTICDHYDFYGEDTTTDVIITPGSNDNYINKIVSPLTAVNDTGSRNIVTFSSRPKLPKTTVAGLPTASAVLEGVQFEVTDSSVATFRSVVAGGGSNHVTVTCYSSSWIVTG